MSREESQEELFNRLLTDLQKSLKEFFFSSGKATKAPPSNSSSRLPELQVYVSIDGMAHSREITSDSDQAHLEEDFRAAIIKVMSSGIFYKGGLKGRPLKRNNLDYKIYFFNDLALFIPIATSHLFDAERNKRFCDLIIYKFDSTINKIYELKAITEVCYSKVNENKLNNIINDLKEIKSYLLTKSYIELPNLLKKMPDRVDLLINLFKIELPLDTPDSVISKAISTLLYIFNTFIEPEAIRQRITRSKHK